MCMFGGAGGEEDHRPAGLQILPMRMPMLAAAIAAKYSTKKVVTALDISAAVHPPRPPASVPCGGWRERDGRNNGIQLCDESMRECPRTGRSGGRVEAWVRAHALACPSA